MAQEQKINDQFHILSDEEKKKLMLRATSEGTVENESYFDLQHCSEGAQLPDYKFEIGIYREGKCPDVVLWYEDGVHFTESLDDRDGSMDWETNDIDSSTRVLKDLTLGQLTWERDVTINVEPRSALYNKIREITMRDRAEGRNGALIKQYSNAGFHMRLTMMDPNGEWQVQQVAMNMVATNWVDTEWLNPHTDGNTYEIDFRLRYWPDWIITGEWTEGAMPEDDMHMQFDLSAMSIVTEENQMTISGVTVVDDFGLVEDQVFRVYVKDEQGNLVAQTTSSTASGDDAIVSVIDPNVFVDGQVYYISFGYVFGDAAGNTEGGKFIHVEETVMYKAVIEAEPEPEARKAKATKETKEKVA